MPTLETRLLAALDALQGPVLLRRDVAALGSARQLSRVLRCLVERGLLVRIGQGIYAKTRRSSVTGAVVPAGSLETLATEALCRLGVPVVEGRAALAFNRGETMQLPGTFTLDTGRRRISRRIVVGGRQLNYERSHP